MPPRVGGKDSLSDAPIKEVKRRDAQQKPDNQRHGRGKARVKESVTQALEGKPSSLVSHGITAEPEEREH